MPKIVTIATYPADDILSLVETGAKIEVENYVVKISSLRLKTFKKNKKCVHCGREGTIMGLDLPEGTNKPHFNLYCKEKNGKKILMTKDHIIPKSRGGKNHISNMQTMCSCCNAKKADKTPQEYAEYLELKKHTEPKNLLMSVC